MDQLYITPLSALALVVPPQSDTLAQSQMVDLGGEEQVLPILTATTPVPCCPLPPGHPSRCAAPCCSAPPSATFMPASPSPLILALQPQLGTHKGQDEHPVVTL